MQQRILPVLVLVALAGASAVALALSRGSESEESQALTPAIQTPGGDARIHNINDAFFLARVYHLGHGPPYDTNDVDRMEYVETTFGRAREVLPVVDMTAPAGARRQEPDGRRVWVIVAYGPFHTTGIHVQTPEPATTFWMVWPEDATYPYSGLSNEPYDLSSLGTVREVELPLPEFPTPTEFES